MPLILEDFLNYLETIKGVSSLTAKEYYYDINLFLKFIKYRLKNDSIDENKNIDEFEFLSSDESLLNEVSITDLYSYLSYLDKGKENSATTRARKISSLRTFYDYLYNKVSKVKQNPTEKLESPKQSKKNPVYLTLEESQNLLHAINLEENEFIRKRDYAIVVAFLNTGMRLSELVSINTDTIKEKTLTVVGKGDKERTIYLNDMTTNSIKDYLSVRPEVKGEKALFLSNRKKRISVRSVQSRIEKYIIGIGLDPRVYSVHKLRHTAATLLYKYGNVDIRTLQEILGHESVATTQIYTHLDEESLQKAIDDNPLNVLNI